MQSNNIDAIVYEGPLDEQDAVGRPTTYFGNTWLDYEMPLPPSNSSPETAAELREILFFQDNTPPEIAAKISKQDYSNPELEFVALLESFGTTPTAELRELIEELAKQLTTICMHYKLKFNRPRPDQLFEFYELGVKPPRANTPAYPSGHALIGRFFGLMLSELYPFYKKQLMKLGHELGILRVVGGFHFRSDYQAAVDLADYLYDNLTGAENQVSITLISETSS